MSGETIDDGGPAYPSPAGGDPAFSGMSLRDWFAGQALSESISAAKEIVKMEWCPEDLEVTEYAASLAYEIADAMLAERKAWRQ